MIIKPFRIIRLFSTPVQLVVLTTLLSVQYSGAQNDLMIDELEQKLKSRLHDTTRLNLLLQLSARLRDQDPRNCIGYALEAADLAKSNQRNEQLISSWNDLGICFENTGELKKARMFYTRAFWLASLLNNRKQLGIIHNNIGGYYLISGQLDSAVIHYTESLRYKQYFKDQKGMAATCSNLGIVSMYRKKYEEAMNYFRQALEIRLMLNDRNGIVNAMLNMAGIMTEQGNLDKALEYYNEGLKIRKEEKDSAGMARCYNGLAKIFFYREEYRKALEFQKMELSIVESSGGLQEQAVAHNNIAGIYLETADHRNALKHYYTALEKSQESNSRHIRSVCYLNLADAYEKMHEFENALRFRKLYSVLNDSLVGEKASAQIDEMLVKYESGQKEQENQLLKNNLIIRELESERSRNMMYTFGALSFVVLLSGGFFFYRQKEKRKVEVLARLQQDTLMNQKLTELELQALRSQINPHFVFNCLSSIQNLVDKGDNVAADIYLGSFAKLMRMVLEFSRTENISLSREIEYLKLYLDLERMRFAKKFSYEIIVEEMLDPDNADIPPMLIQPVVENAVKHGLAGREKGGLLLVRFRKENNKFTCVVEDNGVGRKASSLLEKSKNYKSMGINITSERLNLQGMDNAISIMDLYDENNSPKGTRVEISIPLI